MLLGTEAIWLIPSSICIWKPITSPWPKPEYQGTLLHRSPTPDTCHSRGLEGLLASRQGLRGPWLFPLILPGLDSLRVKKVLLAQAEAEKIRKIGEAEASVIEAMGKAEAERMKLKAEAYQKYGESAKMALVLEALPQVRVPTQAGTGWAHARIPLGLVMNTVDRLAGRIELLSTQQWAGTLQQT